MDAKKLIQLKYTNDDERIAQLFSGLESFFSEQDLNNLLDHDKDLAWFRYLLQEIRAALDQNIQLKQQTLFPFLVKYFPGYAEQIYLLEATLTRALDTLREVFLMTDHLLHDSNTHSRYWLEVIEQQGSFLVFLLGNCFHMEKELVVKELMNQLREDECEALMQKIICYQNNFLKEDNNFVEGKVGHG